MHIQLIFLKEIICNLIYTDNSEYDFGKSERSNFMKKKFKFEKTKIKNNEY